MKDILLDVKNLKVGFASDSGLSVAVQGVSFQVERGKVLGIVGESGSGKSVTSLAVMRLIPKPNGKILDGQIVLDGKELLSLPEKEMQKIRGNRISMIFQEPMSSLNPVFRIGFQLGEALQLHQGIKGEENRRRCIDILTQVRIPDPERVVNMYPHELSGGMRQRVMIAMAMLCDPDLMIADEPTTALDVTIQAQILQLLRDLQQKSGMSIMFITHDLGVIAEIADRVAVMYAGRIVEEGAVEDILQRPTHPYTDGLIRAIPENYSAQEGFYSIPGSQPDVRELYTSCSFAPRCVYADDQCRSELPELAEVFPGHKVRCFHCRKAAKQNG